MTLSRHFSHDDSLPLGWNDLGSGAPSILGLALLCCKALASEAHAPAELSLAAQAILVAAREGATLEIKAVKNAYDSAQRLLAVHVNVAPERTLAFRSRTDPKYTLTLMDGFRELCAAGLIMHHTLAEFSLTGRGLERATWVSEDAVRPLLAQAITHEFDD